MSQLFTTESNRRTFLRNGAKAIAMPFFASLLPTGARAAAEQSLANSATKRLLWMTPGHGHMEDHFYPNASGNWTDIDLPVGFGKLKQNLDHFTMVTNFSNAENRQPHDGSEALLSCVDVAGFPGKVRHNAISCDQVAAQHLGKATRYESMQLDSPGGPGEGHGGVAVSYRIDGSPMPGFHRPLDVYHQVFGGNIPKDEQVAMLRKRQSIFDIMEFESQCLKRKLSKADAEKLSDYTDSVRDIELAIAREEEWINVPKPKATIQPPQINETSGEADMRMMFKMIAAAYQTDTTRVITYRMPDSKLLTGLDISYSPHDLSHYGSRTLLHELNLQRTTKYCDMLSDFIDELKRAKDPLDPNGGNIWDNSMVYFGGGLRTAHRNINVPCLLTGGGFRGLKHGKHIVLPKENTPLANLWLTMMQNAGVPVERFADSTGVVNEVMG